MFYGIQNVVEFPYFSLVKSYNHWCHTKILYGTSGWKVIQPLVPYKKFMPYKFFVWHQWLYDFSTTGAIQNFCMAPVVVWFSKTINECNTLIRARGCMIFNHSCWPKRALRLGWYDFAYTRGFATRVAKSYHPARKALLDQQAWLKIIQPTRAH